MMDGNLQHEDLLIKLRAKLNEEKIKLWETPYYVPDSEFSQSIKDLADKYSRDLSIHLDAVLPGLRELQLHSIERSKANAEYQETGFATFRVKATVPGQGPQTLKIQMKLDSLGSELAAVVAKDLGVSDVRVKLIVNGKVIKPTPSLEEQGVKNGAMFIALIMAETPEEIKKEDTMYMEMKSVRDDAALLSEYVDELADDDEYMKLEDQSGKAVEVPPAEKRSLLVGLALHERGRAAAKQHDYSLALVLFLEADRQFNECGSSLLGCVDNAAVLQLDVAWAYVRLRALRHAPDAAVRLARAAAALRASYGRDQARLVALKGGKANERVLFMRLYLLQGIVAYHQNNRDEAKRMLEKAEVELNALRVDEDAVLALMELGWTRTQARTGLRAAGGQMDAAHHYLAEKKAHRDREREAHREQRQRRALGLCMDGSVVNQQLVEGLMAMGYSRKLAATALRNSNNHVAEAVRLIQEQPELLADTDSEASSDETVSSPSSGESIVEPDDKMVTELQAMGYDCEAVRGALRLAKNNVQEALELLLAGGGTLPCEDPSNPSTSTGVAVKRKQKQQKDKKKKEREQALRRLRSSIRTEEEDYLDTSLVEEEEFLVQYKSLL